MMQTTWTFVELLPREDVDSPLDSVTVQDSGRDEIVAHEWCTMDYGRRNHANVLFQISEYT